MKTQAWGWLVAAVMAAGLNASYHEGGMEWAHRIVSEVQHNSGAVLALATGRTDRFLHVARIVRNEDMPCQLRAAYTQMENVGDRSAGEFGRFEAISARQQAKLDRLAAQRQRIADRLEAQAVRLQVANIAMATSFEPATVSSCTRVRVRIPRPPAIRIPVPQIHVATPELGPI